jgi:hypothetical protein
MTIWQQSALEMWPEYERAIEEAEDPSDLWFPLWDEFLAVTYGTRDETVLRRIYAYAWWSLDHPEEFIEPAVVWFYERLPNITRAREEMHHYLSVEQFNHLKDIWRYGRTEEEYAALLDELQSYRTGKHNVLPMSAFEGISSRNASPKKRKR